MDDELIERVSREICKELDDDEDKFWRDQTGFAKRIVAIVRAAVIEECANRANTAWLDGVPVAEIPRAIRKLKGGK